MAALAVVAATVTAVVAATAPDTDGLTVRPATADGPEAGTTEEPNGDDAEVLDDYAAELGLVMARSRGPQPQAYARRVDEPERLETCPDSPVIELGPAPVEPRLPAGLVERLRVHLTPRPGPVRAADVLSDVRRQYDAAVASEPKRDEAAPVDVMDTATALSDDAVAVADDAVGVAVGRGTECVFVRVEPAGVTVWVPDRVSLQPGEMGCSPTAAATG